MVDAKAISVFMHLCELKLVPVSGYLFSLVVDIQILLQTGDISFIMFFLWFV